MAKLVLWELDSALFVHEFPWRSCLCNALRAKGYPCDELSENETIGWTDEDIIARIVAREVTGEQELRSIKRSVLRHYQNDFGDQRHTYGAVRAVQPGIVGVLACLAESSAYTSLLTARAASVAVATLQSQHLLSAFDVEVGAFGNEHVPYRDLVDVVVERMERMRSVKVSDEDIWLVGSSAETAENARENNVHSLLFATGSASLDELAEARPDALWANASDPEAIVAQVLSTTS